MQVFENWMTGTCRTSAEATTRAVEQDIRARAFLLARLGYPKKAVQSRLRRSLTWEYERVGKPRALKRLATLVTEEYRRAGVK